MRSFAVRAIAERAAEVRATWTDRVNRQVNRAVSWRPPEADVAVMLDHN